MYHDIIDSFDAALDIIAPCPSETQASEDAAIAAAYAAGRIDVMR